MADELWVALLALGLVNLISFAAYGLDKRAAIHGLRRVPESRLLLFAALGGSPGAMLARSLFRHKTRKQPFLTYFWLIIAAQMACIFAAIWGLSGGLDQLR